MRKIIKIIVFFLALSWNAQILSERVIWQKPIFFELNIDEPGVYESSAIPAEAPIVSITANWDFQGKVSLQVSADGGKHYVSVVNGLARDYGFTPGNFLRYRARIEKDSVLRWVKLTYTHRLGVFYTFGNSQLSGFACRRSIYIAGGRTEVFNYPLKIKIENIKGPVRFTAPDGETLLSYCQEEVEETPRVFWVKIPQIPKEGLKIYIYYHNPYAQSLSSPDKVFEFFDDFSGKALNEEKWEFIPDLEGKVYLKRGRLFLKDGEILAKQFFLDDDFLVEFKARTEDSNVDIQAVLDKVEFYSSSFAGAEHAIVKDDEVKLNQEFSLVSGFEYIYHIRKFGKRIVFSRYKNSLKKESLENPRIEFRNEDGGGERLLGLKSATVYGLGLEQGACFDWIRVRPLVEPEPMFLSLGEERPANLAQITLEQDYVSQTIFAKFPIRIVGVDECLGRGSLSISVDGGKKYLEQAEEKKYYYASRQDFICGRELQFFMDRGKLPQEESSPERISLVYFPGTITLISPNGGEVFVPGLSQTILWSAQEYEKDYLMRLEYSSDQGKTYKLIAEGLANEGSYLWQVPEDLEGKIIIKISDFYAPEIFDISNGLIEITPGGE